MLALLTTAAFLIFAQIFMVAPILPRLAEVFDTAPGFVGLAVPAYLVPYGAMTLVWGPLSDRVGRRPVILGSLVAFIALTAATALVDSAGAFIAMRLATAIGASGVVPIALALIGDLVPFHRRGYALGWLFGGMAGGMAAGAAGGALGAPLLGWHGLFLTASVSGLMLLTVALAVLPATPRPTTVPPLRAVAAGYVALLRHARGQRTYGYVLINAVLHSGIYTWLGVYLHQRFGLGELGIGLTLLGYGIPGLLLGPVIGRLADRYGRARIIPAGLAVGAVCALLLAIPLPLLAVQASIITLSLGYDMTQPPLGGIVTDLPGHRGQAMGLNVFTLFTGMGFGSLAFEAVLLPGGFPTALLVFGVAAALGAALAVPLFHTEQPRAAVE
ncbi:MFS transporter [Prauserella coralliicola]|uniref:MFS transporter n=3 Tax=Pseudonocardiaceae TaxID=2070 RepID=A0A318LGC1_9PSEU|nr:MFS transporter [Prauserella flavalba]PXY18696.1 MFS transporter [Prauserella coralliicola]TKG63623.1 MFS transporter [Prauserella endophytica]